MNPHVVDAVISGAVTVLLRFKLRNLKICRGSQGLKQLFICEGNWRATSRGFEELLPLSAHVPFSFPTLSFSKSE
jgi:hypothetical protein